jgi:hypothetical protein
MLCEIFIIYKTSVLALGSIQAPVHWALETRSSEIRWPGPEADHSPASSSEVKNEQSHTSSPSCVSLWCTVEQIYVYLVWGAAALTFVVVNWTEYEEILTICWTQYCTDFRLRLLMEYWSTCTWFIDIAVWTWNGFNCFSLSYAPPFYFI